MTVYINDLTITTDIMLLLTAANGLVYHCSIKPSSLVGDVSIRKCQIPSSSLTSLLGESLGYSRPLQVTRYNEIKNGNLIFLPCLDSVTVSHALLLTCNNDNGYEYV